jgi:ankyrin repeat protein
MFEWGRMLVLLALASAAANADSRLVEAARNQDPQTVRTLVSQHADVNARSDDTSTALLWAAHWNDAEMAKVLLVAGADANAANDFRTTPLSEACVNGSSALVRLLLKSGANPNTAIATGETPLMTCARSGSADAVRMLIEYGAAVNAKEPSQNQTALMWAAAECHPDVVQALIEAHADLNADTKQGFSAVHFAARVGDLKSVEALVAAGVNVNALTQIEGGENRVTVQLGIAKTIGAIGYTPLLVAVLRGHVDLALYLLDHGADPNILAAGYTPLHWAAGNWESFPANPV